MSEILEIATLHGPARAELRLTEKPRGALVLGHGAGGGVNAPDLVAATRAAQEAGLSVALVEQPYRVAGRRSPAPAAHLDAAWTAVVAELREGELAGLPVVTGGRSSGARVACRTAAATGAAGVLCLAFPSIRRGGPRRAVWTSSTPSRSRCSSSRASATRSGCRRTRRDARSFGSRAITGSRPGSLRSSRRSARGSRAAGYPRRVAIGDENALREVIGQPGELVVAKVADRLNDLTRQFIERSPFVCVATSRPDGGLDVSPRGDPAGFVRILDERTLLLPDRPGNKLADTLTNLLSDPRIGLLFLIPGVGETFRVNGRARIVDDPELLGASTVEGKAPKLGILVEVEEAFTQCPKALVRSDLWNPDNHIDRSELPSSGAIIAAVADPELDVEEYERARAERYARREGFY